MLESLESRRLLASTAVLSAGVLTITGTAGNDNLYVTAGSNSTLRVTDNGAQLGTLFPRASVKKILFNCNAGNDQARISSFVTGIPSSLSGGDGNDNLTAGDTAATVSGGSGDDKVIGGAGNDTLDGGAGSDQLSGNAGNDLMTAGDGTDILVGGLGNDSLDGGFGADSIRGDAGSDTLTYATRTKPVTVDLTDAAGELADDGEAGEKDLVRADVETVIGGSGNDKLTGAAYALSPAGYTKHNKLVGNGGNDTLLGLDGNDTLDGGAGNDSLDGADGNDGLNGGAGTDRLLGGAGTDTADYTGRSDALVITLDGKANDGKAGENDLLDAAIENVTGGGGADKITGDKNGNSLKGGGGNDSLYGGIGNDSLDGGAGADQLHGGDGNDTLYAKDGAVDSLFGGNGTDKAQRDNDAAKKIVDAVATIESYI